MLPTAVAESTELSIACTGQQKKEPAPLPVIMLIIAHNIASYTVLTWLSLPHSIQSHCCHWQ